MCTLFLLGYMDDDEDEAGLEMNPCDFFVGDCDAERNKKKTSYMYKK